MMLKGFLALLFAPAVRVPVHDENVHTLRRAEANVLASVELAARASAKMGRKIEVDAQISEAHRIAEGLRKIIDENTHDPDDGLMSGMDRRLEKGDRT